MEACVAECLTPRTLDLEVQDSSLTRRVVSFIAEETLLHFTQLYKPCNGLASHPGENSNTPRHASC